MADQTQLYKYDPLQLAYIAGFFDGEGCIGIRKGTQRHSHLHSPYATVSQTRPAVLQQFKSLFGGNIRFNRQCGKNGIWAWYTSGTKSCLPFLMALEPYLIVKKAEAQIIIETFQVLVHDKKRGISNELTTKREDARLLIMGMR